MRYKIIRGSDPADLAQAVDASMEKGWELYERPFYTPANPVEALVPDLPHLPWVQALVLPRHIPLPPPKETATTAPKSVTTAKRKAKIKAKVKAKRVAKKRV